LTTHTQSTGDVAPCLITDTLNRMGHSEENAIAVKEVAAIAYGGIYAKICIPSMLIFLFGFSGI
jgi:hypothetical protein